MKLNRKYFIFGRCRKRLGRPHLHELKTFKFLGCTVGTDFDESHKPYQALYSRQPRNIHDIFSRPIAPAIHYSPTYNRVMQRNYNLHDLFRDLLLRVVVVSMRVYKWLISPDRTSDTINDRLRGFGFFLPTSFRWRGKGRLFSSLRFSTLLPLAGADNLASLIP